MDNEIKPVNTVKEIHLRTRILFNNMETGKNYVFKSGYSYLTGKYLGVKKNLLQQESLLVLFKNDEDIKEIRKDTEIFLPN